MLGAAPSVLTSRERTRGQPVQSGGSSNGLDPRSARLRAFGLWFVVPLIITALAWQWHWPPLQPASGFDESWTAGLAMTSHNGLVFGQQVVFTYGPLGFLDAAVLWHVHQAELALGYVFVLRFAFAIAVFASARRTFGTLGGFLIALLVASVEALLLEPVVFLIAGVWALTTRVQGRRELLFAACAGAFAGAELMIKVSVGASLVVLTIVLVLSLGGSRLRNLAAAGGGLIASVIAFWLISGQPLDALPDYAVNSLRITLGYGPAVAIDTPGLGWQYAAAIIALGIGVWAAHQTTHHLARRQRIGVLLLWIVFWFFAFKEGFVRHDIAHAVSFFGAVLGGFFAFRWRSGQRPVQLLALASLVVFALAAQGSSITTDVDPGKNVTEAFRELRDVLSPSRRASLINAGRAQIRSADPVDPTALKLLQGHTVAIWPSELAMAWAYNLDWDPFPVLQSYNAYTTGLDQLDAHFLRSSRAPQRILIQSTTPVDDRITTFDEPITSREMLCRYHEIYATPTLAVLARRANRCSRPVLIETVHAQQGQQAAVPNAGEHSLISVSIDGIDVAGLEQLRSFFYKPRRRYVQINGGRPNRLVPGTATDGLPLQAAPGLDYPPPFNIAVGATRIAASSGTLRGTITFRFFRQTTT